MQLCIQMNSPNAGCFLSFSVDAMWLFIEEQRSGAFLYAVVCGLIIGALYDVFRISRAVWSSGRIRTFFDDVVFCVFAAVIFVVFCFNISLGVIRLFIALGALFGFFIYRYTFGLITVRFVKCIKAFIKPYVVAAIHRIKDKVKRFTAVRYTSTRIRKIGTALC